MGRVWKSCCFLAGILLLLCVCRRQSAYTVAMEFLVPNLARMTIWENTELPITSQQENTLVETVQEKITGESVEESLREQLAEENELSFQTLLEEEETSSLTVPEVPIEAAYTKEQLNDYEFLVNRIYNVDPNTKTTPTQLDAQALLSYDFHIEPKKDTPQILIYHTHSQEAFQDSIPGDESTSIVGMGSYLTTLLQQQGFLVIHCKEVFDMENGEIDRNKAYTRAEPVIAKLLEENPEVSLVIDLHRDGVGENVHLVKEIDGKQTAQIMFFNGLSYSAKNGAIEYLPNPYIENNLALTLQMKLASDTMYPGFARKIYLKSLRFNLHLHPAAMLIEAGAQTNTVEEMRNAMEVLAKILGDVLY